MADKPQLNPYNPAEPFIKAKLEGHFIDRLLNAMVETGVPTARALKYFHDEPEGNAGHFLSLLLDDFIPFKYTAQHGGDWSDYAKEAVLLAAPMPKGGRGATRQIDKVETELYNKLLANNIRKQAPSWKQEDFLKLTEERPVQPGEFDKLRMYDVAVPYDDGNIVYASPEGVVGKVEPLEAQTTSELMFEYPFMDKVTSNAGWAIPRSSLANKQYSPTEYLNKWQENYSLRDPEISNFDKGMAKIYSSDVMQPNITNIQRRLLNPGNEYNYTIREIWDANRTLSKAAATDYANATIFKHKDAYLNEIAQVDPVAAENLSNMYDKYLETLVSDMPTEQKATALRIITEDINAEVNMFNLMNE